MKRLMFGALLLVGGCADPAGPDNRTLELGELFVGVGEPRIEAPAVVRAGEPFEIIIYTYGSSCYSIGETRVRLGVREAVIRPFDWFDHTDNGLCFMELNEFAHTAEVAFALPGEGFILVNGVNRGTFGAVDTLWVERRVEVQL